MVVGSICSFIWVCSFGNNCHPAGTNEGYCGGDVGVYSDLAVFAVGLQWKHEFSCLVDEFSDDVVGEVKVASGHFIGVGQFVVVFDGDLEVAAIEVTEPHVAELEASSVYAMFAPVSSCFFIIISLNFRW